MIILIIAEKPQAALKIAEALADEKPKKYLIEKVPYYEIYHKGKKIFVGCAVGHLYTLAEKEKKGWTYPVFDVEWKPSYEVNKNAKFSQKYLEVLKELVKKADEFVIATDLDVEGEVIGLNVLRFVCNKKDGKRMKFSTLTKDELVNSFEKVQNHLEWGFAKAGEARHYLDYYYGISLSRALTLAVKSAGTFKLLSSGRVQGPALKIIVDREKEIKAFKPEPYWMIELNGKTEKKKEITAWHQDGKIFDKKKAALIVKKTKDKKASVNDVKDKIFEQKPPVPFDLTTLQTEAYRCFGITPKEALAIAQDLYTAGLISYPRTSSQKLPLSIGYKKIIDNLKKQERYKELCENLLKKELKPNEGKKSDPAHPSIFPTAEVGKLKEKQEKVYDLIVRRFLSVFAESAERKTVTAYIDVNDEVFTAKGTLTIKKGWHVYYGPYNPYKEDEIPDVKKNEEIREPKIILHEDETKPPKRYTQASIIKEMSNLNVGTKSTRSQIVDALYQRHYVTERNLEATDLGIATVETLEKYCPEILDVQLTRHFEEEMDEIYEGKKKENEVLDEAQKVLIKISDTFKKNEKKIGEGLLEATKKTRQELSTLTGCPICKEGKIVIKRSRFGYFAACDKYPDCKTTFNLPQGMIKGTDKFCERCNYPEVLVIRQGKRPFNYCLNKTCPKKEEWKKMMEEKKKNNPEGDNKEILEKKSKNKNISLNQNPGSDTPSIKRGKRSLSKKE